MKKLMYILAGLIMAVAFTSCEKQKVNKQGNLVGYDPAVKGQPVTMDEPEASFPLSFHEVQPYIIPGKNKGGNRTCAEAQYAYNNWLGGSLGEFIDCGEKVDIDDGYEGLVSGFPFDVWVKDDGSIKFDLGQRECMVKAVIVKGSNKANVYYYPSGTNGDEGLAAPAFEDGRIPWVSNVTFCCECGIEPDEVITVKVKLLPNDGGLVYGTSEGAHPFNINWCQSLGISPFVWGAEYNIYQVYTDNVIGTMTVASNGSALTIDLIDGLSIDYTDLFVGTNEELHDPNNINPVSQSPIEGVLPWIQDEQEGNEVTIPLTP
jgi:hypothetical protein